MHSNICSQTFAMPLRRTLFLLMAAAIPSIALAHDSWLAAGQRTVQPGQALTFEMTSGDHFPVMGSSIARDRIALAACTQAGNKLALLPVSRAPKSLRLTTDVSSAAAVTCWVQLAPRTLDLKPAQVGGYLEEIDATAEARAAWAASPSPKRWRETYTKNAKVVVPQGTGTAAASVPVGMKLEFVPSVDLGAGRVSGSLPVTVLLDGKPLAGISVALTGEKKGSVQRQRSDVNGRVEFPAPQAGRWMLSATDLRVVDVAQGTWDSQFSTLVFDILAGSK